MAIQGLLRVDGTAVRIEPSRADTTDPAWTVETYFHGRDGEYSGPYCLAAKKRGTSRSTLSGYSGSMRRWREFCDHRIHYPVLAAVTEADLTAFQDWLIGREISGRTVNGAVADVIRVLRHAQRKGLITGLPHVDSVAHAAESNNAIFTLDEAGSLYRAADKVTGWPEHYYVERGQQPKSLAFPLADYLRCWLVLQWFGGYRVGDTWPTKPKHRPLAWGHVHRDQQVRIDGRVYEFERGVIVFEPLKTTRKKTRVIHPINALMAAHLDSITPVETRKDRGLFHFPRVTNRKLRTGGAVGFYPLWRAWLAAAGITPEVDDKNNLLSHNPEDWRNTANTLHEDTCGVGDWVTHGKPPGGASVGRKHYYNPIAKLIDSFNSVPAPEAFADIFTRPARAEQGLLF